MIDNGSKFICQNCGKEIKFKIKSHGNSISRGDLWHCQQLFDYSELYELVIDTKCCDYPALSRKDISLLKKNNFELPLGLNKRERPEYCHKCGKQTMELVGICKENDNIVAYQFKCSNCGAIENKKKEDIVF